MDSVLQEWRSYWPHWLPVDHVHRCVSPGSRKRRGSSLNERVAFLSAGVAVVGFVLCTIPKLHYYVLLTSTAFVGATAFMLGVDCYTTAGLKEVSVLIL